MFLVAQICSGMTPLISQEFGVRGTDILLAALLLFAAVIFYQTKRKNTSLPGPWGIPILGYVPFLGKEPHVTLQKLSQKYGGIFGLYLGRTYAVVVNDFVIAKELLNKPTLLDRPPHFFSQFPGGTGFGGSLNGEAWTEQRRYSMREMKDLGFSGSSWEKLVQFEVTDLLDMLKESKGKPTDYEELLAACFTNNILALVSGHRLPLGHPGTNIISRGSLSFQELSDQSGIITFFPSLFNVTVKLGLLGFKEFVKCMEGMNKYVRNMVAECKTEENNFISNYFKEIEEKKKQGAKNYFNEANLIGNVQALILAGTHTTKSSMEWLLLAMASFPDIQDKIHKELDTVFSELELACWDDRRKLPYCQAAILEGQRWRTLVPLGLVHRSSEDTNVRDYVIPGKTDVLFNLWAFHSDTKYWNDPEKFMPERFLTEDGRNIKKCDSFSPFSMGKRNCPGEPVAHIELFIYFTAIMQAFRILPEVDGVPPDILGTAGLTYIPKRQLLRFVDRK